MNTISASELKVGDQFKLSTRHRKVVTISRIIDMDSPGRKEDTDPEYYAKYYQDRLLFMSGCMQTTLLKYDQVIKIN